MFSRLPESNAGRQRRTGGFVVSAVVHTVLIALAVRATGLGAAPAPKPESDSAPIFVASKPAPPRPPAPRIRRLQRDPALPPARESDWMIVIDKIPTDIPLPGSMNGLIEPSFDSARMAASPQSSGSPNVADGPPLPANMVENAVVPLAGNPAPRYPSMLQSAGLEGDVRAQFVVDTLGRVEQGSLQVLQSTHDLFVAAVRDALARARFRPAEVGGRKVRQLVEQTFTFRISR